jgi:tryptophan halogenase
MIQKIIVLGGGSAGFIAAIALRHRLPHVGVTVIRSRDIGIIGVGEGSTVSVANFLHKDVNVNPGEFFATVRPTFKLGIRFIWGPRPSYFYSFGPGTDRMSPNLPQPIGVYCDQDMEDCDAYYAMMRLNRCFERAPSGDPIFHTSVSYHFENKNFVTFLETHATKLGVQIIDDTVKEVLQDEAGIRQLVLTSGAVAEADLFVDCSGFVSLLLGKTLGVPFRSFGDALFCDRAVVGGWKRTTEPIKPYTTSETMSAGWCWQIEHEERINRGYVYSSAFISDNDAEQEFRRANPLVTDTRIVKFVSGIYHDAWVKNVVAIGNSSGFVEPLEATALGMICTHSRALADTLSSTGAAGTASVISWRFTTALITASIRSSGAIARRRPSLAEPLRKSRRTGPWGQPALGHRFCLILSINLSVTATQHC